MSLGTSVNSVLQRVGLSLDRWPPKNSIQRHLGELLSVLGTDCVFDVGANRGQFAQSLREIGYAGHIVSFEPNPALIPALNAASARDPRWTIQAVALGDADETQTLHVPAGDDLASVLDLNDYARASFGTAAEHVHAETVPVRRLDALYGGLRREIGFARPFLKMDTQGYDLHVFRGAEGCWADLTGLITEVSLQPLYDGMPTMDESLAAIREAGFVVTGFFPLVQDGASRVLMEMDCVARRVP